MLNTVHADYFSVSETRGSPQFHFPIRFILSANETAITGKVVSARLVLPQPGRSGSRDDVAGSIISR